MNSTEETEQCIEVNVGFHQVDDEDYVLPDLDQASSDVSRDDITDSDEIADCKTYRARSKTKVILGRANPWLPAIDGSSISGLSIISDGELEPKSTAGYFTQASLDCSGNLLLGRLGHQERVKTDDHRLPPPPPLPPARLYCDPRQELLKQIEANKLKQGPEEAGVGEDVTASPPSSIKAEVSTNGLLEEIRNYQHRKGIKKIVSATKPQSNSNIGLGIYGEEPQSRLPNIIIHNPKRIEQGKSSAPTCDQGDEDEADAIESSKDKEENGHEGNADLETDIEFVKVPSLECSCGISQQSTTQNVSNTRSNNHGIQDIVEEECMDMEKVESEMKTFKHAAQTLESCISLSHKPSTFVSDRELAEEAVRATNIAIAKWTETQSMLAEAMTVSNETARGKCKAEAKCRATMVLADELVAKNKRLNQIIDELQAIVLRQRSEAEHVARAASALVQQHAAPSSALDSNWIGGVWLAVGDTHPKLAKAEKSWSSGHAQRALTELHGLLSQREGAVAEPGKRPALAATTIQKTLGVFSRSTPPVDLVRSSTQVTAAVSPNTTPLTEVGILANLLRAAILHGADQSAHGAAIATAMIAEAQRRRWQKDGAKKDEQSDLERRAKWIRGVCLLGQGRPAEARLVFAMCAGTHGHEKVLEAYRRLAEQEVPKLPTAATGSSVKTCQT